MTTISKKIEIDQKIFKAISKIAKDENTTENKIINQILKKEVEATENETLAEKIERLINGKTKLMNPDRKPDPELSKELIGIIKTKKPFDTLKAIREIRGIE